jgi:hypothetical protein
MPRALRERLELRLGFGPFKRVFRDHGHMMFHVPKAAGTSIAYTLYGMDVNHHRAADAQRIAPTLFRSLFTFGFVRNPYDRLVSSFYFMKSGGTADRPLGTRFDPRVTNMDFRELVLLWLPTQDPWHTNPLWAAQHSFLCDRRGTVLVDFVGRYEDLERDFSELVRLIGSQATLQVRNRNGLRDYHKEYDEATRAAVYDFYRTDFSVFGYSA